MNKDRVTLYEGNTNLDKNGGKGIIEGEDDDQGRYKVYDSADAAFEDAKKRMSVQEAMARTKRFPRKYEEYD